MSPLRGVGEVVNLAPGEIIAVGGRLWVFCKDCRRVVRYDRFLFGSLHLCKAVSKEDAA